MSVPKTPALPLYGKDAYDDEAFSRLTFAEQGLYWYLAWWQWQEGSIPADFELVLDKIGRRKLDEAQRSWPAIEPLYPKVDGNEDRRANLTVERHRLRLTSKRARQQFGASLTNQKRWADAGNEKRTETARHGSNGNGEVSTHGSAPEISMASHGLANLDIVQRVFRVLMPRIVPDDFTVSRWLRDLNPDPWQVAAAACELSGNCAKSVAYVDKAITRKFAEGYAAEDARGYVEHMTRGK